MGTLLANSDLVFELRGYVAILAVWVFALLILFVLHVRDADEAMSRFKDELYGEVYKSGRARKQLAELAIAHKDLADKVDDARTDIVEVEQKLERCEDVENDSEKLFTSLFDFRKAAEKRLDALEENQQGGYQTCDLIAEDLRTAAKSVGKAVEGINALGGAFHTLAYRYQGRHPGEDDKG